MFNNKRIKALEEDVTILQDIMLTFFDDIADLKELHGIYSDNMNVMYNEINSKMDKPQPKAKKVAKKVSKKK